MKISNLLSIDQVKAILDDYELNQYKDEIKYYVHEESKHFEGKFGFYTDKFIVGKNNPHTHFGIAELKEYYEQNKDKPVLPS